jgi:hypothetical protein
VLRKPLGEMGARSYRVTGPWKDPKVEVVGRDAPEAPAQPQPAPLQPADEARDAEGPAPTPVPAAGAAPAAAGLPNPAAAPNSTP